MIFDSFLILSGILKLSMFSISSHIDDINSSISSSNHQFLLFLKTVIIYFCTPTKKFFLKFL